MAEVAIKKGCEMKICVTAEGGTLEANMDPRFGRCRNFILFDTETSVIEVLENANAQFQGGAGIQSGQLMVSKGVKVVLTGNVGPNAHQVLSAAGINIFTGVSGTVKEVIDGYKSGKYKATDAPSVNTKFGMSGGNK